MAVIAPMSEGVRTDAHQVIEDARYFGKHHADILGADRYIDLASFSTAKQYAC